jgi:hypothetical protein
MERKSPEDMISIFEELLARQLTPIVLKENIPGPALMGEGSSDISCATMEITFYDTYKGTVDKSIKFVCPVSEFYSLRTKKEEYLGKVNVVIAWLEVQP